MNAAASSAASDDPLWVVCLCAQWCGTCRDYRPLFEGLARARPGLRFAWVDIEDHSEIADDFDVETFPTLLITSGAGTHFLGPLLPNAQALARLIDTPQPPRVPSAIERTLRAALEASPGDFVVEG